MIRSVAGSTGSAPMGFSSITKEAKSIFVRDRIHPHR